MTHQALKSAFLLLESNFFKSKINRITNQPQLGKNHGSEDTLQSRQSNWLEGKYFNEESEEDDLEGLTVGSFLVTPLVLYGAKGIN